MLFGHFTLLQIFFGAKAKIPSDGAKGIIIQGVLVCLTSKYFHLLGN